MKRSCPALLGASEGNHLRTAGGPAEVRTGLVMNTIEKRESEFAGPADRTCFSWICRKQHCRIPELSFSRAGH
jgi:hypothetical protein